VGRRWVGRWVGGAIGVWVSEGEWGSRGGKGSRGFEAGRSRGLEGGAGGVRVHISTKKTNFLGKPTKNILLPNSLLHACCSCHSNNVACLLFMSLRQCRMLVVHVTPTM